MKTFQQYAENLNIGKESHLSHIPAKLQSSEDGSYELEVYPGDNVFEKINDAVKLISRGAKTVSFVFNNKRMNITRENYIDFINNVIPRHFS